MAKRALLVGCNYPGTEYPLNGCVNDALAWVPILRDIYGFQEEDIEIMIDTDDTYTRPTGKNIKDALRKYVAMSEAGDVLFFQFSGHGVQVPDDDAVEEADRQDEAICPTDMNLIIDDDMREIVNPLNPGGWAHGTVGIKRRWGGGQFDSQATAHSVGIVACLKSCRWLKERWELVWFLGSLRFPARPTWRAVGGFAHVVLSVSDVFLT